MCTPLSPLTLQADEGRCTDQRESLQVEVPGSLFRSPVAEKSFPSRRSSLKRFRKSQAESQSLRLLAEESQEVLVSEKGPFRVLSRKGFKASRRAVQCSSFVFPSGAGVPHPSPQCRKRHCPWAQRAGPGEKGRGQI